jgi:hypothetical protein
MMWMIFWWHLHKYSGYWMDWTPSGCSQKTYSNWHLNPFVKVLHVNLMQGDWDDVNFDHGWRHARYVLIVFWLYLLAITNTSRKLSRFLLSTIMSSHLDDTLISQDNNVGSVPVFPWKTMVKGVWLAKPLRMQLADAVNDRPVSPALPEIPSPVLPEIPAADLDLLSILGSSNAE